MRWRVAVESATIAPPDVDGAPVQGRVVSSWRADGELIEPLGSMSRLPDAFLRGGHRAGLLGAVGRRNRPLGLVTAGEEASAARRPERENR